MHAQALAALEWYQIAGVDELTLDTPVDHYELAKETVAKPVPAATSTPTAAINPSKSQATPAPAPASSVDSAAMARQLADQASSLEMLRESVTNFDGCALKETAMNCVFADGTADSDIMLIGEAPGAEEDKRGIPFCGASGQLLDEMLSYIDLRRHDDPQNDTKKGNLYITNTLFWRPPGNRTPTADELASCLPFVEKHIALIDPKALILVGGTSAKSLLGESRGITRLHGQRFTYTNDYLNGKELPVFVFFHPSYLLRQPMQKKLAWQDMLDFRSWCDEARVL